jgi:hypothetical protein
MKKSSEYRQHAEECGRLARTMKSGEQHGLLLQMAATWEGLAEERSSLIQRHPKIASEKTGDES